jgi:N-acetylneuraminic acid mutarotase
MNFNCHYGTVDRYNIEQNQWYLMPSMTTRRSDAAAVNHRGTVYVCGGFDSLAVLSTVEYFDAKASQWKRLVRAMPVGLSGLCALSYQGNLVVLGGFTGENRTSQVLRYNDIDMQWESMPDMNMARYFASL